MLFINRLPLCKKHVSVNSISTCYKCNTLIRKNIQHQQQVRALLIDNKYSNSKRFTLTGRYAGCYGSPGQYAYKRGMCFRRPHHRYENDEVTIYDKWETAYNNMRNAFRRKMILIKGKMIKRRNLFLNVPLSTNRFHTYNWSYSYSDLCGHGAFFMLGLSYLETEIFNLRLYAATGITLSILFQYYREKPLWIPIRWNTIFLLINSIMIAHLLKEQYEVLLIPQEQMQIYDTVFKVRGMKPVDFLHLMSIANRHELKKGEKLIKKGTKHSFVHLLQDGRLSVKTHDEKMITIKENQFAGTVSFVKWQADPETTKQIKKKIKKKIDSLLDNGGEDFDNFLNNIRALWTHDDNIELDFEDIAEPMKAKADNSNSSNNINANNNRTNLYHSLNNSEVDVTAEEDCIIYSWDFLELEELLATQTQLGIVFGITISADILST